MGATEACYVVVGSYTQVLGGKKNGIVRSIKFLRGKMSHKFLEGRKNKIATYSLGGKTVTEFLEG